MAARKALKVFEGKPGRPQRRQSKRERLEAQRERIAEALFSPATSPRDLAALSRQMMLLDEKLDELEAVEADSLEGAVSDDAEWEAI